MPHSRGTRVLRGLLAALFATFVALLMHVAAGGEMPHWIGIVAPLVLSTTVCTLLAGRRVGLIRLSVSVSVSQALFHLLFVLGSGPAASSAGHHHGAVFTAVTPTSGATSMDVTMTVAHALAAAVTIAALYSAERIAAALLELAELIRGWVLRRLELPRTPSLPAEVPSSVALVMRRIVRPLGYFPEAIPRRGPPARLA